MERRSSRGRPVTGKPRTRYSASTAASSSGDEEGHDSGRRSGDEISATSFSTPRSSPRNNLYILADDIPTSSEELVLNKRGMPVRQRKRNSFYYGEEMVTTQAKGSKTATVASAGKKVKTETLGTAEKNRGRGRGRGLSDGVQLATPPPPSARDTKVKPTVPAAKAKVLVLKEDRWSKMAEQARSAKEWDNDEEEKVELSSADMEKVDRRRTSSTAKKAVATQPQQQTVEIVVMNPPLKSKQQQVAKRSCPARFKQNATPATPPKPVVAEIEKKPEVIPTPPPPELALPAPPPQRASGAARFMLAGSTPTLTYNPLQLPILNAVQQQELIAENYNQRHGGLMDLSHRVRNFLKLPKSHKWVCYEWFYSTIDQVLFKAENDFQMCLRESFPALKTRKLTRIQWTTIRRIMGKPRRCSSAFLTEERLELHLKRQKIREIQQRKLSDLNQKELPDEIPLQLVIGTKVTARLRIPQDGLFEGRIEGVDTSNSTYRISFQRSGVGVHSVRDFEVSSNEPVETVSTSSFALKIPRRLVGEKLTVGNFKFQNPALLALKPEGFPESPFDPTAMLGGFPIRLLDMIVQLSKLLKKKRIKIAVLRELNVEAEKMTSYGKPYNQAFKLEYARCVRDMGELNKVIGKYMAGVQAYCVEISSDSQHSTATAGATNAQASKMINSEQVLERCRQDASMMVSNFNDNKTAPGVPGVKNPKILELIRNAATMMLGIRANAVTDKSPFEVKPIQEFFKNTVKANVEGKNLRLYEDRVEMVMNRMIAGLCVKKDSDMM